MGFKKGGLVWTTLLPYTCSQKKKKEEEEIVVQRDPVLISQTPREAPSATLPDSYLNHPPPYFVLSSSACLSQNKYFYKTTLHKRPF